MSTNALAVVPQYQDPVMLQTIKDTVCKGASESQFRMFIEVCKATGLNPFLKEIYYAPQIGVMASRDGYLRKANDHPQFDGMETRVERDEKNVPIKAVCSVWRKDRNHPVICEAYYSEYKKASQVWQQYPSAMIAKVAEVLALKRSFAINGVVTEEEIGEQGSKEAQQEYLRSKGIGIDVGVGAQPAERTKPAQGSLAAVAVKSPSNTPDVRAASEQHKALILETAKMLDDPPRGEPDMQSVRNLMEIRHASQVAEADEALKEVAKPPAKKKGHISFEALKSWKKLKDELRELTGTDTIYYTTLKAKGFEHANQIDTEKDARQIFGVLGVERNRLKQEKELMGTLEHANEVLGARVFSDLLGAYGAERITDVFALTGDSLGGLLKAIKDCVDAKNGGKTA